jgi:hypothetical protein
VNVYGHFYGFGDRYARIRVPSGCGVRPGLTSARRGCFLRDGREAHLAPPGIPWWLNPFVYQGHCAGEEECRCEQPERLCRTRIHKLILDNGGYFVWQLRRADYKASTRANTRALFKSTKAKALQSGDSVR